MRIVGVALFLYLAVAAAMAQQQTANLFSLARCTALPLETQMHGCAVVGERLYVFGGESTRGYSDQVYSAKILDSGSLSEWREEAPLPDRRHYLAGSVEVVNNRIYVAGGTTAAAPDTPEKSVRNQRSVLWTAVLPDGSLGKWSVTESFPAPNRVNPATCSTDKHLYISGGISSSKVSDAVLMADFASDGGIQNWRSAGTLPIPMWYHGAAILDRRLYVWGGLTTPKADPANDRVFSAEVKEDGTLAWWREETAMSEPVYSAAFCGFNDYLVCVGGRLGAGVPTGDIWFSRLEDGKVGEWRSLETDLETRIFHALGLDRNHGRVYIAGGKFRERGETRGGKLLAAVQAFQLGGPSGGGSAPSASASAGGFKVPPVATAQTIQQLLGQGRTVLLYFHSPQVPAVGRFEQNVLAHPEFSRVTQGLAFHSVDSSVDQELCYKYSVFRIPALVRLTPDGQVQRSDLLHDIEDVQAFLQSAPGR